MTVRILQGDCREALRDLPAESVHCCVTSPPYFGLRDYGVDGQIGLEQTPAEYVEQLVEVFREVRRVLRDDGTLWLNLADSYASDTKGSGGTGKSTLVGTPNDGNGQLFAARRIACDVPAKNLLGIPWRVAFALQADGWWLRQDVIWHKPNPMPESVTDRCTKAHEYVFLLSKSERYYWNREAMQEVGAGGNNYPPAGGPVPGNTPQRRRRPLVDEASRKVLRSDVESRHRSSIPGGQSMQANPDGMRNKRSVWTIATQPFAEAHFATMPPELAEQCIRAGCPEGGTVLDPFGGAGTTGLVADRLQRDAVLCELNPQYIAIAERRIHGDAPLFAEVHA